MSPAQIWGNSNPERESSQCKECVSEKLEDKHQTVNGGCLWEVEYGKDFTL